MKNNIILVGMMGAGKSNVARHLVETMPDFNLVDLDDVIEKSSGLKIHEIFEKYSEAFFRELETDSINDIIQKNSQIISTGGGAFEKEVNQDLLKNNGTVIYLKASAEELFNRVKNETHRPLLKANFSLKNLEEILSRRVNNYEKAHIIIDTTNKTFYNIVMEIQERITSRA